MQPAPHVLVLLILVLTAILSPSRPVRVLPGGKVASPPNSGAATQGNPAEAAIGALLRSQAEAWNRGDIEGFMQGYWKSDRTTFAGSSGVLRGWQALLDRYRRSYPDRAAMGRLEFSELEVTPLGPDSAMVLGHWQLERGKDRPGGVFTLVARRLDEGWRIIHDHTSVVAPMLGQLCGGGCLARRTALADRNACRTTAFTIRVRRARISPQTQVTAPKAARPIEAQNHERTHEENCDQSVALET